jgi:hypothetical protein
MRAPVAPNGWPIEIPPPSTFTRSRPISSSRKHAPHGWREPADAERESLERLHIAVAELFKAVSNALLDERESAEECIRRASAILRVDLPEAISDVAFPFPSAAPPKPIRGGLAPWQIRRVTTYIEMNLGGTITTKDLATLARLSSYHFCRAFRHSFGDSPHGFGYIA